jgi:hypothetical protein
MIHFKKERQAKNSSNKLFGLVSNRREASPDNPSRRSFSKKRSKKTWQDFSDF